MKNEVMKNGVAELNEETCMSHIKLKDRGLKLEYTRLAFSMKNGGIKCEVMK